MQFVNREDVEEDVDEPELDLEEFKVKENQNFTISMNLM